MARPGLRVAVIGATGAVGEEIISVLEERKFPVQELRMFASEASAGTDAEFRGDPARVELLSSAALAECDLIFCAAPQVLEGLQPALRETGTLLVDVSGALELDPAIPLYLPGAGILGAQDESSAWLAIPRGVVAGLGLVLAPLAREVGLERVTALCLEPSSGAGRKGVEELTQQTLNLLNTMTGEAGEPQVFPRPLAFDCLPLVGESLENGDSSEERRLRHVLRRLLGLPTLLVESTRVRVPIYGGSLACVHLRLAEDTSPERARAIWEKQPYLGVLDAEDWPTPREALSTDGVRVGRIRATAEGDRSLACVVAQDDLRYGSALAAVMAAETLCRLH